MTTARPISATTTPETSASWPRVGPTTWDWAYSKDTGSEPDSRMVCSALASSKEYWPVMDTSPLGISDCTAGADCTSPSKMMTILPWWATKSREASAKALAPWEFNMMFTL